MKFPECLLGAYSVEKLALFCALGVQTCVAVQQFTQVFVLGLGLLPILLAF